jgi:maleylpyruvate isomerase
VLREDLLAAGDRFMVAATELPPQAWAARITARRPEPFPAAEVPSKRLHELWVHLVDLDAGVEFTDVPETHLDHVLAEAVSRQLDRPDGHRVRLTVELPDGRERVWDLVNGRDDARRDVSGAAADVVSWLTGRGDGSALRGDVPVLPSWG